MTSTIHLALPFIEAAQAQKHVTHNDALELIDALAQLSVLARDVNTPPASPAEGARYIVGAAPTGAFATHANQVATWLDGVWRFLPPRAGWLVWIEADNAARMFDGTLWRDFATTNNLALLGVGTTADATNPLAAKLNSTLFTAKSSAEGGTGDMRFNLNKSAAANAVSQLYQDNFSGRAETGLVGDDHYRVKVSADGATWRQAIDVDPATGIVSFPSGAGAGSLAGFRNRIVNSGFTINQRAYASGAALAANAYAHDRWKAGASGAAYAFAPATPDTTITITSGQLRQIVEGAQLEGGTFTLSWSGTSQGRINGGAFAASPITVTGLAAGADATIEFGAGTLGRVQFESGAYATTFERRPPAIESLLAYRYFLRWSGATFARAMFCYCDTASTAIGMFFLPVAMRATPTVAQFTGMSANNAPATFLGFYGALNNMLTFNLSVPSGGLTTGGMTQLYVQSSVATGFIDLSAEI